MIKRVLLSLVAFGVILSAGQAFSEVWLGKGQTVYVPVYSHILIGTKGYSFDLAVTLSIRNTDFRNPITISSIDYYDTEGRLVKRYLNKPLSLNPMASTHVFISETDTTGGIGANFIVRWRAEREVNEPVIESVMIGGRSGQGISFVSQGREIRE
ncbi:MAG: DUF3124 domain-containing protein [Nitrospirales bacterium]|nr:DUF3124 domain-containing protein [Nitrospirales bacterium]